jgi:hypothetical protein
MKTLELWLAQSALGSVAKVFLATLLGLALMSWVSSGDISLDEWETWVIAALSSSVPMLINWLNPADARYGKKETPSE